MIDSPLGRSSLKSYSFSLSVLCFWEVFRLWTHGLMPLLEKSIGSWSNVLAETFRAGAILVQLALVPGSGWILYNTLSAWHRCWRLVPLNSVVSLQSALHHCGPLEWLLCPLDEKGCQFPDVETSFMVLYELTVSTEQKKSVILGKITMLNTSQIATH